MKTLIKTKKILVVSSFSVLVAVLLAGCSSEEDKKPVAKAKITRNQFDHTHGKEVTDLEKHKFEHEFAEQCVNRELKNSVNKDIDKKRYEKTCLCIATFMMEDLTAKEAEKFLEENKNTRSLQIRFDNAAYNCLQKQAKTKSPMIFNRRQSNRME